MRAVRQDDGLRCAGAHSLEQRVNGGPPLEGALRVLFDVTYTRTQRGAVGITRTVRRLLEHLHHGVVPDLECIPVAFHTRGFRDVASDALVSTSYAGLARPVDSLPARMLRHLTESRLRRKLTDALPLGLLHWAFLLYRTITFNALSRLFPRIRFRPGDVLVLCDASWNYDVWGPAQAAQRCGARVVVMVHDLIPVRHPEYCAPLFHLMFHQWLLRMVRCADAIVCNSASTMRDLQDYAREQGWALPPVSHFRLGSDVPAGTGASSVRRQLVQMTSGSAPCFAAVGSIEPRKNYGLLLAAFEQLWAEGHDVKLVIIGRAGAECGGLVDALISHPENGRRLLPLFDASDAELAHAYSGARALVFPSLAEGFGLPLVEARTRGALVIASDIPVFRELADDGVLLFDRTSPAGLHDCILEVARDGARPPVAAMPAFTWSDSARQLVAVTRSMLVPVAR